MKRAFTLLFAGALIALGASACGGGGSNAVSSTTTTSGPDCQTYEGRMQALGTQLDAEIASVGTANRQNGATPQSDVTNLKTAQSYLRRAAADLTKINPPSNAKPGTAQLRLAVLEYANELTGVIKAVGKGNTTALSEMVNLKGIKDMSKAALVIKNKGYDIIGPQAIGGVQVGSPATCNY